MKYGHFPPHFEEYSTFINRISSGRLLCALAQSSKQSSLLLICKGLRVKIFMNSLTNSLYSPEH